MKSAILSTLLQNLQEAEAKATPGPWHQDDYDGFPVASFGNSNEDGKDYTVYNNGHALRSGDFECDAKFDAEFSIMARNSLPTLLAIIEKQNEDNPQIVAAILARYDFLPFDDKSEEEVAQILSVRSPVDDQRVLRENWLEIFIEIENENIIAPFYLMTYEKKKAVVQAKVDQFKSKIVQAGAPDQEDPTAIGEGGADDETDQPDAQ